MLATLQTVVGLLVVLALIAYVAGRFKLPSSILLVLAGTVLALSSRASPSSSSPRSSCCS
jgi:Kef-type K+ transport system membrane component KefB